MRKTVPILFFLSLYLIEIQAQMPQFVQGVVLHQLTEENLDSVKVQLLNTDFQTVTDKEGHFTLIFEGEQSYPRLVFSKQGYYTYTYIVKASDIGNQSSRIFYLEPNPNSPKPASGTSFSPPQKHKPPLRIRLQNRNGCPK